MEIQDLEDDISGLKTRIDKYNKELSTLDGDLSALKITKKDAKTLIKKYDKQIANIKNTQGPWP